MYKVNNQDETIYNLTQEQYNFLLSKVEIFRLDGGIRIADIYCGSSENTIRGLDALFKLLNNEGIKNVEELKYAIKLIDGLCIELDGNEKAHIKSQVSINNLEYTCPQLFDGRDFVLTKVIDECDLPHDNIFYHNNCLYFIHLNSLYAYNFTTSETTCLLQNKKILGNPKYVRYLILNNYVYLYVVYVDKDNNDDGNYCEIPGDYIGKDGDNTYNVYYEIDTKLHTITVLHPWCMDWLNVLYSYCDKIEFSGTFPKNDTKGSHFYLRTYDLNKDDPFSCINYEGASHYNGAMGTLFGTEIHLNIRGKLKVNYKNKMLHIAQGIMIRSVLECDTGYEVCKFPCEEYDVAVSNQDGQVLVFKRIEPQYINSRLEIYTYI